MYNVTICFSASDNWYGKLIRKITKSSVNHTFIQFQSYDWQNTQTIDVDDRGVMQVSSKRKHMFVKKFRPKGDADIILSKALRDSNDMIGKRYDWLAVVGFLVKLMAWKLFLKRMFNPWHKANKMFCSEFVTAILKRAEFIEVRSFLPQDVYPGFLMSVLEQSDDWEEVEE